MLQDGHMRALLPEVVDDLDDLDDLALHRHYARDWLEVGGVRANFVASADGAVSLAGRSAGLQTPGDNRVFAALRNLADAVLVGAGTARIEGYAAVELSARRRATRRQFGLDEALPVAVVSHSLQLDPAAALFTGDGSPAGDAPRTGEPPPTATAPHTIEQPRTIVITHAAADAARREQLAEVADVLVCGDRVVDLSAACRALAERGLTRLLCEGGPTLFAGLARAELVDELCLSLTPLLTGPGPGRITAGGSWPAELAARHRLRLDGLLEEDNALFCRYHLPH